jgi:GNAT superfamily N-acetyltransferase
MDHGIMIKRTETASPQAGAMIDALWNEIQLRYGFSAPNPIDIENFSAPRAGFWTASHENEVIGSIALISLSATEAELDIMYVVPAWRSKGVAQLLMRTVEQHAKENGFNIIKLRAGEPQPDALKFYAKEGFQRIPAFGRWVFDDTAICLAKAL